MGEAGNLGAGGRDILLVKFDAVTRDWLWTRMWGYSGDEVGTAIAINSTGNILVAGNTYSLDAGQQSDIVLLKYNPGGSLLSALTWGEPGIDETSMAMNVDVSGVSLVGSIDASGNKDALVVRLDSDGNHNWARSYGGALADLAMAAVSGADDGVVIAGVVDSDGSTPRASLMFFNGSGELLREQLWSQAPSSLDALLDVDGVFIMGGSATDASGSWQSGSSQVSILGDRLGVPTGYLLNTPPSSLLFPSGNESTPLGYVEDTGGGGRDILLVRYIPGSSI